MNPALDDIPFSAFEDLERRIAATGATGVLRLHQGKTSFPPCATGGAPDFPMKPHEHAPPGGALAARRMMAHHVARHGLEVPPDDVIVTGGSTQAIATVYRAILEPGDEVLVLSPQWLFAVGLVAAAGGRAVEVPVFLELCRDPDFDIGAALSRHATPRTRALYFNTPNNPTGYSLTRVQLAALASFAEARGLWIIADQAYENYDDSPDGFIEIASIGAARTRTFAVYTLSKTYAMAGYRTGWIVAPPGLAPVLRKWSLYAIYSHSTAAQAAAVLALSTSDDELAWRKARVREIRELVHRALEIPAPRGTGGLYAFLDLSAWRGGDFEGFLDHCVAAGVTVAPGIAFGQRCASFARLCFTAVPGDQLAHAIERLNQVYRNR
jgi:aspartate aminotransferase